MTSSRDDLLNSLAKEALDLTEVLPSRISSPTLQPPTPELDWPAGVTLQRCVEAGITNEELVALVRQVRVRAIADALGLIDQSALWTVCEVTSEGHQPLGGLDGEFWFVTNLTED